MITNANFHRSSNYIFCNRTSQSTNFIPKPDPMFSWLSKMLPKHFCKLQMVKECSLPENYLTKGRKSRHETWQAFLPSCTINYTVTNYQNAGWCGIVLLRTQPLQPITLRHTKYTSQHQLWSQCHQRQTFTQQHKCFLQCLDTVGLVTWPVKIVPDMTYNVFVSK